MVARSRGRRAGLVLATAAVLLAGCASGGIVNNDEPRPTTQTSTSSTPPLAAPPNNDHLANAFDYAAPNDAAPNDAAETNAETGYYFTSPSKRWVCAVIPRVAAGCQSSTGSTIPITGAPASVPGADGTQSAPNAIQVGVETDAQFASVGAPGYSLVPRPAVVLPFGELLIVAGFRCNVQEATGISCASEVSGKGFTFSQACSCRNVRTPTTSMPSTRLASPRLSMGTTTAGQPSRLAASTAGSTPFTGRTRPSSASSPSRTVPL